MEWSASGGGATDDAAHVLHALARVRHLCTASALQCSPCVTRRGTGGRTASACELDDAHALSTHSSVWHARAPQLSRQLCKHSARAREGAVLEVNVDSARLSGVPLTIPIPVFAESAAMPSERVNPLQRQTSAENSSLANVNTAATGSPAFSAQSFSCKFQPLD